ncbi:hypothetical protein H0H87_002916 [Tephrocybe sp. NHM501043]|nr:hypothetical protein H0H87_002916 [Tephrocybe sp. NHM501043]
MDAQRFDLAKRSRSTIVSHSSEKTSESRDSISFLEFFSSPSTSSSATGVAFASGLKVQSKTAVTVIPKSGTLNHLDILDAQRYDLSKSPHKCQSVNGSPATSICSSPSLDTDTEFSSNESQPTEEVDEDSNNDETESVEFQCTTCTIIRPPPRSPILEIFSRPSSPVSLTSRPGSPISLNTLNCFGSRDNFEDEVEFFQAERARRTNAFRVYVTHDREVHREETWREQLQEMLYGPNLVAQNRVVNVCRD